MVTIDVLISTMNLKGLEKIKLPKKRERINYIIINQIADKNITLSNICLNKNRNDVKIYNYYEIGLSKSRNRAIEKSTGDICLISDEDVVYKRDAYKHIISAFEKNPKADIITFQIETPEGAKFKEYENIVYFHNLRTLGKVSSIEIAFRREVVIKNNLKFDEDFGLGTIYCGGEEIIFLMDAYKKGLKILYFPIPIVIHPYDSSGKTYTREIIVTKGALFGRIFGPKAFFINILFAIKKYYKYKDRMSFIEFNKLELLGTLRYLFRRRGIKN